MALTDPKTIFRESCASKGVAVTPSDDTVYSPPGPLWVTGDAGDVEFETVGGSEHTVAVETGDWIPFLVSKVKAATTATGIILAQ